MNEEHTAPELDSENQYESRSERDSIWAEHKHRLCQQLKSSCGEKKIIHKEVKREYMFSPVKIMTHHVVTVVSIWIYSGIFHNDTQTGELKQYNRTPADPVRLTQCHAVPGQLRSVPDSPSSYCFINSIMYCIRWEKWICYFSRVPKDDTFKYIFTTESC